MSPNVKQVIFKQDPGRGMVTPAAMEVVEVAYPSRALEQDEVLIKALFISLDPYMRGRMNTKVASYSQPFTLGKPMDGGVVAEVIESRRDGLAAGDKVIGRLTWESYSIVPAGTELKKLPAENGVPLSYYLGVLGMPGMTAYHGLLNIGNPKPGETVFVSGAAGAVGLIVGQIAKIKGCRVIGSAGTDDKVELLKSKFGYDAAFNYKTVASQSAILKEYAPNGIDVYFDNVGGETLDTVLVHMNTFGRLIECGMISQYNAETPYGIKNLVMVVGKQLRIEGFIISSQSSKPEFVKSFVTDVTQWILEKKIYYAEHVVEGIESIPSAFIGLMTGDNTGKFVIKL
ncbi:oxidoreductase, zinc-binding protein [Polychytrium aggregatum]|uniref:oxidoreductase, zinc-binding protein n=1 Tax=Polychytrium aggregatum TaxID=110093 RepID=UPI0022FE70BA|nr:oxidoreductase, zinc-binding protein [Polychytrium aggregatum]KAI9207017.1 oxidoreductase, zinc-binding protein [Polychytrium aggregatum]